MAGQEWRGGESLWTRVERRVRLISRYVRQLLRPADRRRKRARACVRLLQLRLKQICAPVRNVQQLTDQIAKFVQEIRELAGDTGAASLFPDEIRHRLEDAGDRFEKVKAGVDKLGEPCDWAEKALKDAQQFLELRWRPWLAGVAAGLLPKRLRWIVPVVVAVLGITLGSLVVTGNVPPGNGGNGGGPQGTSTPMSTVLATMMPPQTVVTITPAGTTTVTVTVTSTPPNGTPATITPINGTPATITPINGTPATITPTDTPTLTPSITPTVTPTITPTPTSTTIPAACRGMTFDQVFIGTAGADVISVSGGPALIFGLGGNDVITSGNRSDCIDAGPGNDTIFGGNGRDVLVGGAGSDVIDGGNGRDWLLGGTGNDTLIGDNGDDRIDGGPGADLCSGGRAPDVVVNCEQVSSAAGFLGNPAHIRRSPTFGTMYAAVLDSHAEAYRWAMSSTLARRSSSTT